MPFCLGIFPYNFFLSILSTWNLLDWFSHCLIFFSHIFISLCSFSSFWKISLTLSSHTCLKRFVATLFFISESSLSLCNFPHFCNSLFFCEGQDASLSLLEMWQCPWVSSLAAVSSLWAPASFCLLSLASSEGFSEQPGDPQLNHISVCQWGTRRTDWLLCVMEGTYWLGGFPVQCSDQALEVWGQHLWMSVFECLNIFFFFFCNERSSDLPKSLYLPAMFW